MAKEELKYSIQRNDDKLFTATIYRKINGEWELVKMNYVRTMWGGKRYCRKWIKNWSDGKFSPTSYMNVVTVDRKWN